jgi:hypothetical protein
VEQATHGHDLDLTDPKTKLPEIWEDRENVKCGELLLLLLRGN